MKNLVYYCDMDGVLADMYKMPNSLERFKTEKDFFKLLDPIIENVNAIKALIAKGEKVRVLSASPNMDADNAKREWLARYLPEVLKRDIIIVRNGESKIERVPKTVRKRAVLFDDYGKNLREWVAGGGKAGIKILGNNPKKENRPYHQITNVGEWVKL